MSENFVLTSSGAFKVEESSPREQMFWPWDMTQVSLLYGNILNFRITGWKTSKTKNYRILPVWNHVLLQMKNRQSSRVPPSLAMAFSKALGDALAMYLPSHMFWYYFKSKIFWIQLVSFYSFLCSISLSPLSQMIMECVEASWLLPRKVGLKKHLVWV